MSRVGILTSGVLALILLAGVGIPQHPFSLLRIHESVDHKQLWFDTASLPMGETKSRPPNQNQLESTDHISGSKE
jgi:hypothetical protein